MISFTGGTVSGRKVASTAAPMFKKVSLELGGKNASIIFADCDFEKTVEGVARAAFLNQGEICLCGSRIFVELPIYRKFVDRLVEVVQKNWNVGNPFLASSRLGSLISKQHMSKIEYYVGLALEEGGKVLCGGQQPKYLANNPFFADGAFYEPTIIEGLDPTLSRAATEEIFGPVVTVHPFASEAEVLDFHNRSQYGLAGSVWTQDITKGHRVAQSMETGMVWVNCWLVRDLRVPFGGVKNSGLGREGGRNSLETFSQVKNICVKL
jgi:aminomuconate-semialdehyde/2-hydroxymuconate-6-semialdehyde dehydrogenase